MKYVPHFRHFVLLVLSAAAFACNTGGDKNTSTDGAGPSVGKSVGGDSAINVEKSRPMRNVHSDPVVPGRDTLR